MDIANFSMEILAFLFLIGVLAGFLDTLVGGGGLLAVPALLLSGIPPIYVLGTNKFQGSMGTGIATFLLFRKKKLDWQSVKNLMIASHLSLKVGGKLPTSRVFGSLTCKVGYPSFDLKSAMSLVHVSPMTGTSFVMR